MTVLRRLLSTTLIINLTLVGTLFFPFFQAKAKDAEEKVIANLEERASELYESGKDYYQKKGFLEALIEWDKLLSLSSAYYEEIDKYLKKIEKVPLIPEERELLSRAQGKVKIARRIEVQAVKHTKLGKQYYKQGEYHKAVDEFSKVLSLKPRDVKAREYFIQARNRSITPQEYIEKVHQHLNRREYKAAQKELELAHSIYPKNNDINRLLYRLYRLREIQEK